jgi:hypothetical protein
MKLPARTICALFVATLLTAPVRLRAAGAKSAGAASAETTLRGKLVEIDGNKPAVEAGGDPVMLAGRNHYVFATLKDKRLAGHHVALQGHKRADGFFQVDDIHTIHHGKLYWIRYFCETCDIAALGPGDCVCCQQPTELQEIPVGVPPGPDPKGAIITK